MASNVRMILSKISLPSTSVEWLGEMRSVVSIKSIGQRFGDHFIQDITQTNWEKIRHFGGALNLRNQDNVGDVNIIYQPNVVKDTKDNFRHILAH